MAEEEKNTEEEKKEENQEVESVESETKKETESDEEKSKSEVKEAEIDKKEDSISDEDAKKIAESPSSNKSKAEGSAESTETMADPMDSYPILIVDDDRWLQRIFSQYLKSWGFTHLQAMNPFEGLELALKHKPLVIFLDIVMPDVRGDIVIKFLKGMEEIKDIPVVIISSELSREILQNTYKDGASGFISKPFTKEILYSKLKEVLDRKVFLRMVHDGLFETQLEKK